MLIEVGHFRIGRDETWVKHSIEFNHDSQVQWNDIVEEQEEGEDGLEWDLSRRVLNFVCDVVVAIEVILGYVEVPDGTYCYERNEEA